MIEDNWICSKSTELNVILIPKHSPETPKHGIMFGQISGSCSSAKLTHKHQSPQDRTASWKFRQELILQSWIQRLETLGKTSILQTGSRISSFWAMSTLLWRPSTDWMKPTPVICFIQSLLIWMLIPSKNGWCLVKQLTGYHNLAKVTHKTYRLKSSEGSTELDVKVVHPQSWPWMLAWWVLYYPWARDMASSWSLDFSQWLGS